jgi:hypothetical protein
MLRVFFYVVLLAAVIYAVFWAIGRRNQPPTTTEFRGPVGPDDDEDFLRKLERERRHRKPEDPA